MYPTDIDLTRLKGWDFLEDSLEDFLKLLSSLWHWSTFGYKRVNHKSGTIRLELHTGGWSGNEDIIAMLQQNIFWSMFWQRSRRGGHYYLLIDAKTIRRWRID